MKILREFNIFHLLVAIGDLLTFCLLRYGCSFAVKENHKGAFHYAKISGNFGRNINGTLWSTWKFSEESGPPPEVVLFDRSVRSDRNLPFHFEKFSFPVPFTENESKFQSKLNGTLRFGWKFCLYRTMPFLFPLVSSTWKAPQVYLEGKAH